MKERRLAQFVPALLDPEAAIPPGLVDRAGRAAGKRFDVYRNNVAVGLADALEVDQASVPGGIKLVTYHDAYAYFADTYGWNVIGAVQPVIGRSLGCDRRIGRSSDQVAPSSSDTPVRKVLRS